jgi:hypothetical protein
LRSASWVRSRSRRDGLVAAFAARLMTHLPR